MTQKIQDIFEEMTASLYAKAKPKAPARIDRLQINERIWYHLLPNEGEPQGS